MAYVVDIQNGGTGRNTADKFATRLLEETDGYFVEVSNQYLNSAWDIYESLEKCDSYREFGQSTIKWKVTSPPVGPVPFDLNNGWKITKVVLFAATDYDDYSTWRLVNNLPTQEDGFIPVDATSFTQNVRMQGDEFAEYRSSLEAEGRYLYAKYIAAYRPGEKV